MNQRSQKRRGEIFWPKILFKKWLNISPKDSDFSADDFDTESEVDDDEKHPDRRDLSTYSDGKRLCRLFTDAPNISRRRHNSETMRAQYINTKELKIHVGTWNVGGRLPPEDLEIDDWIDVNEPADIYVIGLQEIVPLNAGNVLGAEDYRPVPRWESIIRRTLNRTQPILQPKLKYHSDPPSPSSFKESEHVFSVEDELLSESDTSEGEQISSDEKIEQKVVSKRLDRLCQFNSKRYELVSDTPGVEPKIMISRTLNSSEIIGLSWPEKPLDMSYQQSSRSFKSVKSFRTHTTPAASDEATEENHILFRRKRSGFVKVISKQMVGIFISVWVRRSLRKNVGSLKISTVGVGVMGYIGNKGSISISMSIYQTMFCFICTHLSSGEKEADKIRRNSDVQDIHRRTRFNSTILPGGIALPRTTIHDHERIVWLGDLNYRINATFEKTHKLISRKDWSNLAEIDQLKNELKRGCAFDGWMEGVLNFPPTYKYDFDSDKYVGGDTKTARRTPAWCDRILSYGKDMKLLKYGRSELSLSDHRPVTAVYLAEVEVFSSKKLQKALSFVDSEIDGYNSS
ncbi:Type I inositol-1,4,5-trisphosphate 5-phosphatase [Zostera marina]|uniref:Type I inositol-1,4,5-trisphosphate 5-phosphatase n=1 Tax=Zostera marina TaxID=29655 RepID=A0A0K9NH83_ZOSMR|nr:Type I inositol-1,4,5-trisphosphate 5-phosphatase [Zostera marina]